MNTIKLVGIAACIASLAGPINAESSAASAQGTRAERKINQYINGNLFGIQSVKKDANKRIISLVSIGRAPISSALSKARAKNHAFKRADANARAEFMKWLNTAVVYAYVDQNDVAIVQKGESLGDSGKGKSTDTSEVLELSQEQTVSVASGFVKGMVQLGAGINDDGEAVVVLGWNASTAEQTDVVREQNAPKKITAETSRIEKKDVVGANAAPSKAASVSDAAGDFF